VSVAQKVVGVAHEWLVEPMSGWCGPQAANVAHERLVYLENSGAKEAYCSCLFLNLWLY